MAGCFREYPFSFKFKLISSFFLIKKNQKIKTAPARAKTPTQRLNGNELASLKQISVLIAFVQGFLNARSDDVNPFRGSPSASPTSRLFASQRRLSSRECAALFLSIRARFQHRLFIIARRWHRGVLKRKPCRLSTRLSFCKY